MSDNNVASRLKLFLEREGISSSQFADSCQIPRPSLSQFLTGRNKKISDVFVGQIHNHYPSLNILWLLFGEGEMISKDGQADHPASIFDFDDRRNEVDDKLSFKDSINPIQWADDNKFSKETPLSNTTNVGKQSDFKTDNSSLEILKLKDELDKIKKFPRKVVQITIYYDDSTFETFYPGT